MIIKFDLFLESIVPIIKRLTKKKKCEYGDKRVYKKPGFDIDSDFIDHIYLDDFNKNVKIGWYDTAKHNMFDKIDKRTKSKSMSDFNNSINKELPKLFYKNLQEIDVNMSIHVLNRIAVKIKELGAYLIISYDHNELYDDDFGIFVVSVVPCLNGTHKINRIFYL